MKKKYLAPEIEVASISTQTAILTISNGESLTNRTYGSRDVDTDETTGFWD